ncbi:MAG TPA: CAP domain-containing protein [Candidatus Eremiobacteraceae bacterium]|nr:CAP domain-containing protein [Candidatus Eremiobacteraceae bacterium]
MLARNSLASPGRLSRIVALTIALLISVVAFETRALGSDSIPTVVEKGHTYVAVEPLLRDLEIGYDIEGSHLTVNGRSYPPALVEINGMSMANARDLAAFLNLKLTDDHGSLVFGQPQTPAPSHAEAPPDPDLDAIRAQLIALLDEHRNAQGVGPLGIDPRAQAAAQAHALDMARDGVLRHVDPDGRTPFDRYHAQGGHSRFYAENVAWYGLADASRAALASAISKLDSQMMAERPPDDGHRANIVSPIYDSVGIGIAVGPNGIYLTEDFSGS